MQLLEEKNVVMTPYSPLAAGRLSRTWEADTARSKNDVSQKQNMMTIKKLICLFVNVLKK